MIQYLPSLAGVALLSFAFTKLLIPISHAAGLLDHPQGRKVHQGAVPLVGGISIYLSVLFCAVMFLNLPESFIGIALICGLITFIGALDDRYPVHPYYRLTMQLIAGVTLATVGGANLRDLGDLTGFGAINLGLLAIPFTAVAITGLCNAYNMVDGIDGLAGSLTIVSLLSLLLLANGQAPDNQVALLAYMATSIGVFLLFNLTIAPFAQTKIFMGDAGSTFLGCAVAIAMIHFTQSRDAVIQPATALWLVAIPLMDMASTMVRRISKGRSPFHADRTHLHHILMRAGFSQRQALIAIILAATALAGIGIMLERVWPQSEAVSFGLFLITFGLYFQFIFKHAFKFARTVRRLVFKKAL
jgi:UDP-GlcNAc:undecaprenyl-phosphate GlcNAc-1-phosphate transferase